MGWGNCGLDSKGRHIGYVFGAICDEPECEEKIDRGLSYACGGMHGEEVYSCEKYFCPKHLGWPDVEDKDLEIFDKVCTNGICAQCQEDFIKYILEENDA